MHWVCLGLSNGSLKRTRGSGKEASTWLRRKPRRPQQQDTKKEKEEEKETPRQERLYLFSSHYLLVIPLLKPQSKRP